MEFRRVLFRSHGSNTRRALVSFTQHASAHAEISRGEGFTTEQEPADTEVGGGTPAPTVNAHLEVPWTPATQPGFSLPRPSRSEEHTSELQSLMRISYAVFALKKKNKTP